MYEESFLANDWTEGTALKYFPTFLRGTALDWFKTMVRPKKDNIRSWNDLKRTFSNHYLGRDELRNRRQELAATVQGIREPATSFIPRVYRMIKVIDNNVDEEEAVEKIVGKMRPEIIKFLPLDGANNIEELVSLACKAESRARQIEERAKVRPKQTQPETKQKDLPPPKLTKPGETETQQVKCYRCTRLGHIARECTATSKPDGKPCKERQIANGVNTIQEPKLTLNESVSFEDRVNTIDERKPKVSSPLLFQKVSLNGYELAGLVDTGSLHTIIDESVARLRKWKIEGPAPLLGAAGENPLRCIGTCKIEIELTINNRTRKATMHIAVVENLGTSLLIGFKLLSIFHLIVDAEAKQI